MSTMTITEALAEIKLIEKKVISKTTFIKSNPVIYTHVKDVNEAEGGTPKVVQSEMQAISDLQTRLSKIRVAIARANLVTLVKIGEVEKTIFEWLVWKREIAKERKEFIQQQYNSVNSTIRQYQNSPRVVQNSETKENIIVNLIPTIPVMELQKEIENLQYVEDTLDGQLSLKNATTYIEL